MNDEQLKKEIEEALAVEPSPQFVARVRRQITDKPRRRWMGNPWKVAVAGLVAAGIVATVALLPSRNTQTPQPVLIAEVPPAPAETPALTTPVTQAAQATTATQKRAQRQRPAELEVLVDPREAAALHSLLDDIDDMKIDPKVLAGLFDQAARAQTESIAPMPIAGLEPMVIQPLNLAVSGKEGGSL